MLEDNNIDRLILLVEKQIDIAEDIMKRDDIEDKFKYLFIGKVNGMLEALRQLR